MWFSGSSRENMKWFILVALFGLGLAQHNPHTKHGRTAIVHLFEWRWADIAAECERFLGPNGYGGVQVRTTAQVWIERRRMILIIYFFFQNKFWTKLTRRRNSLTVCDCFKLHHRDQILVTSTYFYMEKLNSFKLP